MVSKQTRIWTVNGHEVQFDIHKFKQLFKSKAYEAGIGLIKYEEVVANAISVDSSTIHNWRSVLNGPSDPEKVTSLEKFWEIEEGTLLKEVFMNTAEVTALTDRELAALRSFYIAFKSLMDFYYNTEGFNKEKCNYDAAYKMYYSVKGTLEREYIDLKKKLYDALENFVDNELYELLCDAANQDDEEESELIKIEYKGCYEWYVSSFNKIVDPFLLA